MKTALGSRIVSVDPGVIVSRSANSLVAVAPAKVNLTLEVLGKLPTGYHAIETLMLPVDLFDTLEFTRTPTISLTCDRPGIPTDERNLVWKAAKALQDATGCEHGAAIHLTKRIPHEAGLGGGSSDAATTLLALNELWNTRLPLPKLSELAANIGSDVPFFLHGTSAWCTGRGEVVEPEVVGRTLHLVIAKIPGVGLSTKDVYQRVVVPDAPTDSTPARLALRTGDVNALGRAMMNRLQAPAFTVAPVVESLRSELATDGPPGCHLSGSGSAVFALCRDAEQASRIATAILHSPLFRSSSLEVYACRSWHAETSSSEDRHPS